jgi:hypothetical protein
LASARLLKTTGVDADNNTRWANGDVGPESQCLEIAQAPSCGTMSGKLKQTIVPNIEGGFLR